MPRNKYPEETVQKILDASLKLFLEKGYEETTVLDIISEMGGLTRGAFYHHFKSKEDILIAVTDRMTMESNQGLAKIRDASAMNGKEKLQEIFKASINRPVQKDIFTVAPDFQNNPRLLDSLLRETVEVVAPYYILPIIKEGIEDGSIRTEFPEQLAELIILAANIWINPMVFDSSPEESYAKFMVFIQMMQGFGLDIVDEEMVQRLQELAVIYNKKK